MSNYPDDMHCFDWHPRSPYYNDGGEEDFMESRTQEILQDLQDAPQDDLDIFGEYVDSDEFISLLYRLLPRLYFKLPIMKEDQDILDRIMEQRAEDMARKEWESR